MVELVARPPGRESSYCSVLLCCSLDLDYLALPEELVRDFSDSYEDNETGRYREWSLDMPS